MCEKEIKISKFRQACEIHNVLVNIISWMILASVSTHFFYPLGCPYLLTLINPSADPYLLPWLQPSPLCLWLPYISFQFMCVLCASLLLKTSMSTRLPCQVPKLGTNSYNKEKSCFHKYSVCVFGVINIWRLMHILILIHKGKHR